MAAEPARFPPYQPQYIRGPEDAADFVRDIGMPTSVILLLDRAQDLVGIAGPAWDIFEPESTADELRELIVDFPDAAAVVLCEHRRNGTSLSPTARTRLEAVIETGSRILPVLDVIVFSAHRWRSLGNFD